MPMQPLLPHPCRPLALQRAAAALAAWAALSHAEAQPATPPQQARTIDSCVAGSPAVPLAAADRIARLDARDAAAVLAAAEARWPLLGQHRLAAAQVLLLGHGPAPGGWRYVLLDPAPPGTSPCATAVLSGQVFDFTPQLVQKYRAVR